MDDSHCEYEYEYADDETEDVYVTLDLTTHIPQAVSGRKKNKKLHSNKSLENVQATAALTEASPSPLDPDATPAPDSQSSLQIVDLHALNPIIALNGAVYSCHWGTDLGTSLFVTPPGSTEDSDHDPLHAGRFFDVLATTSARLIAVPASIRPRVRPLDGPALNHSLPATSISTTAEGDTVHHIPGHGLRIELPAHASAAKVGQARFLERLSAAKALRGETDPLPIQPIRPYSLPDNWEEVRDQHLAVEIALSERNKQEAAVRTAAIAAGGRKRRRRAEDSEEDGTPARGEDEELAVEDAHEDDDSEPVRKRKKPSAGRKHGGPGGAKKTSLLGQRKDLMNKVRRQPGRPRNIRLQEQFAVDEARAASSGAGEGSSAVAALPTGSGDEAAADATAEFTMDTQQVEAANVADAANEGDEA